MADVTEIDYTTDPPTVTEIVKEDVIQYYQEKTMADVIETDYSTNPPTITERDFTDAERAQIAADAQAAVDAAAAAEAKAAADAAKRVAVLERLGLSEDEVVVLLGGVS